MLSVGPHTFIILNFVICYRNHIFIHREPLIASLTTWKYNVSFLQGIRAHALPLISDDCEMAAQACVASHRHQVDYVVCVCAHVKNLLLWTKSFHLQYFSKLGHGKNVAQSFVNKIPLKVPYKRMYRTVESLWVAGSIMYRRKYKNGML